LAGGVRLVYQADLTNVDPGDQKSYLEADAAVINARVNSLGATEPQIKVLSGNRIEVKLPGIKDINKATELIGRTAILEFGEITTDNATSKWSANGQMWKPASGTLKGQVVPLTSSYFKSNASITTDGTGKLLLAFEWNDDGSVLSKEITTRRLQSTALSPIKASSRT
jgi:preprotein translocase subunit SecD